MAYDRTQHIIGYGKQLAYCSTSNGTFIVINATIKINLPERDLGKSELTNDSSPDFHKDYTPGLYEPGTMAVTYRYTRSQFAALEAVFQLATVASTRAQATQYWKVTLPDGSTGVAPGFMTKHNLPIESEEDSPVVDMEIQTTGKLVFTQGSGS